MISRADWMRDKIVEKQFRVVGFEEGLGSHKEGFAIDFVSLRPEKPILDNNDFENINKIKEIAQKHYDQVFMVLEHIEKYQKIVITLSAQ
jgi:hypothetical protein